MWALASFRSLRGSVTSTQTGSGEEASTYPRPERGEEMGSSLLELNQREACRGVSVNVRGLAGDRCGGPVGVLVDGGL